MVTPDRPFEIFGALTFLIRNYKFLIMKTNSSIEPALHIMLLLAAAPVGRELAANDLADFHELRRSTLAKVLQQLAAAGLVVGSAGRYGGYRLARSSAQISVYQVAAAIEGVEPSFHCHEIRRNGPCAGAKGDYSPRCAIAQTMDMATLAWRSALEKVSIADLLHTTGETTAPAIQKETEDWFADHLRN
ncbi:Rrf2 family transcriptional regulator [Parasphingorhabdus sp.]|uniref:RrF2 family transcriptional regulator n=2 Tax=Parasphingorhabdus sp. TaxID=2709688 RepID=UPI0032664A5B